MFKKITAATAFSLACSSAIANPISEGVEFSLFGTIPSPNFVVAPVSPEVLQGVNEVVFNEATGSFVPFITTFEIVSANNFTVTSTSPSKLISGTDEINFDLRFNGMMLPTGTQSTVQSNGSLDKQYFPLQVSYPPAGTTGYAPGDYTGVVSLVFSSTL